MKYHVEPEYSSAIPSGPPSAPTAESVVSSIAAAKWEFEKFCLALGRQGIIPEDGGPIASLYRPEGWDGITYADGSLVAFLGYGPRGAIRVEYV